jgi:hypothetical protein
LRPVGKPAHAAQLGALERRDDGLRRELAAQQPADERVALGAPDVGVRGPVAAGPVGRGPLDAAVPGRLDELVEVARGGRLLVDHDRGRHVAASGARDLVELDVGVLPVPVARCRHRLGPVGQPAGQVATDLHPDARRRAGGAEVRVEGDQPLQLVERPALLARQRDERLARQPAVLLLDRVQGRHEARAGEPPVPSLHYVTGRI